jgi:signal transduction histidine kinase
MDARVTLEVTGSAEVELNADARKIRQALLNLVLNAMQASPTGEKVTIDIGRACSVDGFLRLRVIDRGAGMSKDVLERIRKPYFTTREGGTGLGVAVARGIVEQHGGHVAWESAIGKGTTVILDLPRCAQSSKEAQKKLPFARCGALSEHLSPLLGTPAATSTSAPAEDAAEDPVPAR